MDQPAIFHFPERIQRKSEISLACRLSKVQKQRNAASLNIARLWGNAMNFACFAGGHTRGGHKPTTSQASATTVVVQGSEKCGSEEILRGTATVHRMSTLHKQC